MSLRLRGLSAVDPTSVPLPNGTEVVTRVDRLHGDRVVPQGAIGRVLGQDGVLLTVRVVGVGPVVYRRDELVPRKRGQLDFALRRADAWSALSPCVVLETTVGSRAWGLAEEGSDHDRRGVFALPFLWGVGLAPAPEELISLDGSATYWSVDKAVRQALRADPNTLEMLFLPAASARDPLGEWLLAERTGFASREIYASFGRYALSQLKKLSQTLRLAEHRRQLLAWVEAEPALDLDRAAARLAASADLVASRSADAVLRAKEYIKQLCRSLHDHGLTTSTEFAALGALVRDGARGGAAEAALEDPPRELRPKNAYNLLRLLHLAVGWLGSGEPCFVAEGPLRQRLLCIKRGEVPLPEILAEAEALTPALEEARVRSPLPERADLVRAHRLLVRVSEELARRHLEQVPGPFGREAPPPELVSADAEAHLQEAPRRAEPDAG